MKESSIPSNGINYKPGDKVHYLDKAENGLVKRVTEHGVFVVYHCDNDWPNYTEYTAALTPFNLLIPGWRQQ